MTNLTLSIIIVSYKDAGHIKRCVSSIYQKIDKNILKEIIIVNNDKEKDMKDIEVDFAKIKIINNLENLGFGAGVNIGANEAKGEILLILNQDTEILTDNIELVMHEFQIDDKVGIIGSGILDKSGKNQEWSAGKEISIYELIKNNLGVSTSKSIWNSQEKRECDWVAGTAMFVRKKLFWQLKGFDQRFFMYFEDMDFCKRARMIGENIQFFPEFRVLHGSGESYSDKCLQKKHYYDSMEEYFAKNMSVFGYKIITIIRKFFFVK